MSRYTATMTMPPVTTVCHSCGPERIRRPFVSVLMMNAPMTVPRIEPSPPDIDGLPLLRDREDTQAVRQCADDERADDRPEDRALAAGQRGAADHRGRDRVQLVALAERGLRRIQSRADEHPGDTGEEAAHREDGHLPRVDVDTREPRGLLVA